MIKELGKEEIEIVENYICLTRDEYPFYFLGDKQFYSDRGFLINNSYYVNLQYVEEYNFLGICKLRDRESLVDIIKLFKQLISEYKAIDTWVFKNNKPIIKLLTVTRNYFRKYGILSEIIEDEEILIYRFKEV